MDRIVSIQTIKLASLNRLVTNHKKANLKTKKSVEYLEKTKERFETLYKEATAIHDEALSLLSGATGELEHPYFKEDIFGNFDDECMNYIVELTELISETKAVKGTANVNGLEKPTTFGHCSELKLPRINLPNFSGNYELWVSFKNLFTSLIRNRDNLSAVEKLQYLKSSLSGEAAKLLSHFAITEANFDAAWQVLNDRYDNKNVLLKTQLRKLFNLRAASESALSLKILLDSTVECIQGIEDLNVENVWDAILIHLTAERLPGNSRQLWEQHQASNSNLSSFTEIKDFITTRFRALEATGSGTNRHNAQSTVVTKRVNNYTSETSQPCPVCNENHTIVKCKQFIEADSNSRFTLVKRSGLCINCLRKGHFLSNCPSTSRCSHCRKTHHSLLHRIPLSSGSGEQRATTSTSNSTSYHIGDNREVLLATAVVTLESSNGRLLVRALLDQGSQVSIITESVVQQLGLKRQKVNANIFGVGQSRLCTVNNSIETNMILKDKSKLHINALMMKDIGSLVPSRTLSLMYCKQLNDLQLADPHFDQPGKVDLLLGADIYASIILGNMLKLDIGPIAQETRLGWIISGETRKAPTQFRNFNIRIDNSDIDLSEQLQLFWKLEEVHPGKYTTLDEQQCEDHYMTNVTRKENGRYMLRLPFRSPNINETLGNSRVAARACLLNMERKFSTDPQLKDEYSKCLQEYLDSGYMEECIGESLQPSYYLPHHAIRKESSTSKLRVVFDASRKTSSGVSLNDILLTGPSLSSNMISVLLRWRLDKFAYVADIARMFLQIEIHPDDRRYQMILWRKDSNESLKDYYLKTVTFGTTCAPFLAIRTLRQLAEDEKCRFPNAHRIILENFYVDDVLAGGNSLKETIESRKEIDKALSTGGFKLRKWVANDPRILEGITTEDIEQCTAFNIDMEGVKSLGIVWLPDCDNFTYRITMEERTTSTKRSMLSDIARLYDPMGWLAPVIITGKIFLKTLWLHGIDWDEAIPQEIETQWTNYRRSLLELEQIRIPRYVGYDKDSVIELHGFCDASKVAYAAAIYMVSRKDKESHAHLLMSKTKVSPVKEQTTPRLELCGAVLLSELMRSVIDTLKLRDNIYLWCDSSIVLAYIKKPPQKLPIFEANRTIKIIENVGSESWNHVRSKDNPADIASRGTDAKGFSNVKLWWYGPPWLMEPSSLWPNSIPDDVFFEEAQLVSHLTKSNDTLEELLGKFSSLTVLLRVTAYCLRFVAAVSKRTHERGLLSTNELDIAREFWIKHVQHKEFTDEIGSLNNGEKIDKKSKLRKLYPYIDAFGILRLGGRLTNSDLSNDEKNPIIIPKKGSYTDLLVRHTHERTLHGNVQLMLTTLRRRYWVIDGRNIIKNYVHKCVKCFRNKTHESSQLMGSLPKPRVTITRPFTHTGVDYCGPFLIKDRNGRGSRTHKAYVVIFVCFAVKAIHIELVNDLTTQTFLAALSRFVGRRGLCQYLYSDCGTNFIGANVELRKIVESNNVQNRLVDMGITWKFNPPASPHFGGLWEAGVRSIKYHLRRIVGTTPLTYEEMLTALIQIERCLNSRPLCPISDDPSDESALTPAHFLIGDNLMALPEIDITETNINRLTRWQLTQRLAQNFWRKWKDEYLNILQQRPKWLSPTEPLKIGDLCLLKDDRNPPYRWPLARVVEVHSGTDSIVRVVSVKCNGSIYKRSITKIIALPIN